MAKRNEREFGPGERWADLDLLREEYPNFKPFIFDVMTGLLGFECSDINWTSLSSWSSGRKNE